MRTERARAVAGLMVIVAAACSPAAPSAPPAESPLTATTLRDSVRVSLTLPDNPWLDLAVGTLEDERNERRSGLHDTKPEFGARDDSPDP